MQFQYLYLSGQKKAGVLAYPGSQSVVDTDLVHVLPAID